MESESKSKFEPDPKIQQAAEAYSRDLASFVRQQFGIALDWSDASIQKLESIATTFHDDYKMKRPPLKHVEPFYRMFGSYLGEVYRRNHGAEWGWAIMGDDRFPGLRCPSTLFWPWARAHNRIVNGPEDNLWHYYQQLLDLSVAPQPKP
jgi:hypothetical protein